MGITPNAVKWVNTAARVMNRDALNQVEQRAVEIAEERKATRLGKKHLEQALQEFAEGKEF